jgi:hypothetical protein
MMGMNRTLLLLVLLLALPVASDAQELSLNLGRSLLEGTEGRGRDWQLDFRYRFPKVFSVSGAYINEGHLPGHKRDGLAAQLWAGMPLFRRGLSVDFGAGFYRYSDTQPRPGGYVDENGWAAVYSAVGTYYLRSPWFFRIAANRIRPTGSGSADTHSYTLGAGYRLWKGEGEACPLPPGAPCPAASPTTGDEATVFLGQSVVNSLQDQKGLAAGIEFRKGIYDHVDATLAWIYEGDRDVIRRNGAAGELWLVDEYLDRRLVLGVGGGGYAFLDKRAPSARRGGNPGDLAGLLSLTAGWRLGERWTTRFNWHRVVSHNNRDTDVFIAGFGYRWEEA